MAWTANGPISTPGKGTIVVVACLMAAAAVAGSVMGLRTSLRDTAHETIGAGVDDPQALQDAAPARPIVDITPVQAPPAAGAASNTLAAATNATATRAVDDQAAATNDIAVRAAAVQAQQNNPAQPPPDIDALMTSQSERPQAPAKPSSGDESGQGSAPDKSDVPF